MSIFIKEYVIRLNITMYITHFMDFFNSEYKLCHVKPSLFFGEYILFDEEMK